MGFGRLASCTLAVGMIVSMPAQAAITIFTDEPSFRAAVGSPVATDTFDDLAFLTFESPIVRAVGPFTYRASVMDPTGDGNTQFTSAGGTDAWLSTNYAFSIIRLDGFSPAARGLGGNFFTSDLAGAAFAGTIKISVADLDSSIVRQIEMSTLNSFLGFVSSNAVSRIDIESLQPDDGFLFPTANNLLIGAVPEPKTWLLLMIGFGMLGASLRRARRSAPSYAKAPLSALLQ